MKSKGLTYGLLVVVVVIWYQVFIRVKSNLTSEESSETPVSIQHLKKSMQKQQDFELQADFDDPFRIKHVIHKSQGAKINNFIPNNYKPVTQKQSPETFWPVIKYYGFVKNKNSRNPRVIVSIDNNLLKLNEGEIVFDNIKIVNATKDNLKVKYKGQTKVFSR